MDPISMIGLATTVLRTTGLGEKIGSWIGGDSGGEAAKKVLDTAQKVTGAKTPQTATERLSADPELAAKLKERLIEQETEILELHLADVQDARSMQKAALQSDDRFVNRFILYFASFWSIIGAGYMFSITFFPIPESGVRFADTALGFILGTIIAQILNFFFGSSKGSSDKTGMMKEQLMRMIEK
jgi:hypothetical protein